MVGLEVRTHEPLTSVTELPFCHTVIPLETVEASRKNCIQTLHSEKLFAWLFVFIVEQ